jgi:hypothetical protein
LRKTLKGKVLVFHEQPGDDGLAAPFRQLVSEGELRRDICVGGEVKELKLQGSPALIENTTDSSSKDFASLNRALALACSRSIRRRMT